MRRPAFVPTVVLLAGTYLSGQTAPAPTTSSALPVRDPQTVALAGQAVQVLAGGTSLTDVLLQARVTYIAGSDQETGTATLEATASSQSRMVLSLSGGARERDHDHEL